MPYFYNNYLLANLSLDMREHPNDIFLNHLTRMEHLVYDHLLGKYILKINDITPNSFAEVHYECLKYDFGKVKTNDTVQYYFKYKNIGKIPYIIYNIESSCHCTTSEWSKKPVATNAQDSICVLFSQETAGVFKKTINIKSNARQEIFLEICGEVIP